MYVNIRGIKGKRSSLIEQLDSEKPHIFLLTETLLPTNTGIQIDGYTFFGRARQNGKGGGVGILVRDDIKNSITPHISDRDIELMWISIRRKNHSPLFIGCYYGRQESRCSKEQIDQEMYLLSEEIGEYQNEGETIIFMDGNGKIGILGEQKSRNGKLLENIFEAHNLIVLNQSEKCQGQITRQNTKNVEEKSAIDFVAIENNIEQSVNSMKIDEEGIHKIRGKTNTDHNTIIVEMKIEKIDRTKTAKTVAWRLNAPSEQWESLKSELGNLENGMQQLFSSMNQKGILRPKQALFACF